MSATLSDVAARAGVSISAASRVLSRAPSTRVRPETRDRIETAARDLGYRPNFAGRALKLARSDVLAMIVPDLTNPLNSELLRGVDEAATQNDYLMLLGRSEDVGGAMIGRLIGEGRVDGILLQTGDDTRPEDVRELLGQRAPVIFINSVEAGHAGSVTLPNAAAAAVATRHLLQLGHTKIALVGGLPSVFTSADRESGYRAAMADAEVAVRGPWLTRLGYTAEQGRRGLRRLWRLKRRPTGVVVGNLNAAIGVLAEARAIGVAVPDELSVVALHDAWTAEQTAPALTCVRMPMYDLGRTGVELLLDKLRGTDVGNVMINSEPELVVRHSTAPAADRDFVTSKE
ncbi:LacI family transcriptional regulator [Microlunatus elymi]|uniref:LacI family transcriptional regulator n=1 Tax=Microlunatus elymi TaxID=2596828 RepID=A0A516Q106_9ACTN|nr:LacI family DNA-binding transcriptional regulator [Microlunatus elymi]QDP97110.1 LacI family transcriptional regulator [Microlunatus elymi]